MKRIAGLLAVACTLAACGKGKSEAMRIQTVPVGRQSIRLDAQATGTVEPINIVEVKSKASGLITKMTVETGALVKPGDLLVQIDTRDVQNQFNQSNADVQVARENLTITMAQKKRSDTLFAQKVITTTEHEAAVLAASNAQAQLVRTEAALDLSRQRLEDATVTAPVAGTIIDKTVSLGTVITSATSGPTGGTTLLKMADLTRVRVRAFVNETDIGQVQPGQEARVTVDAHPDRPFVGAVEKIEPQAVVQQSVTMFPVLISVSNQEGLLLPGMNGEVSILIEQKDNVLAVSNDALKNPREAAITAPMLGLDPAAVQKSIQDQMQQGGGQRIRMMGGPGGQGGSSTPPAANGKVTTTSRGEVDLAPQQGQQGGQGGMQMPEVTQAQCDAVKAAFTKHPEVDAKITAVREKMRAPDADRAAIMTEMQNVYKSIGLDGRVAMACRMKERQAQNGNQGGGVGGGATIGTPHGPAPTPGTQGGRGNRGAQQGQGGGMAMQGGAPEAGGTRARSRLGVVFVADSGKVVKYTPRIVRLGIANFDYTEVVSGLKEGEQVVLLAALTAQQQRQASQDQMKQRMGGGMPGMQQQQRAPGGGGARPPAAR